RNAEISSREVANTRPRYNPKRIRPCRDATWSFVERRFSLDLDASCGDHAPEELVVRPDAGGELVGRAFGRLQATLANLLAVFLGLEGSLDLRVDLVNDLLGSTLR